MQNVTEPSAFLVAPIAGAEADGSGRESPAQQREIVSVFVWEPSSAVAVTV